MPGMYDPAKTTIDLGVPSIAPFTVPAEDRNRTSPFPYGGHRFEFRAVGSTQASCITPLPPPHPHPRPHTAHAHIQTWPHTHIHTWTHTHIHTWPHTHIHTWPHAPLAQRADGPHPSIRLQPRPPSVAASPT